MTESESITESMASAKVGMVASWSVPGGMAMGVVVGQDDKDVLAVSAYTKDLKTAPSEKKFLDQELTAKIANLPSIQGVLYAVHRVPRSMATYMGKVKGRLLARYKLLSSMLSGKTESLLDASTMQILEAVAEQYAPLAESEDDPPFFEDAFLAWEQWLAEAESAPLPKHYQKACSLDDFNQNVRYFYKVKGAEWEGSKEAKLQRAIAASYSVLRRACGVPDDAPKMTPSEIVSKGKG